MSEQLFSYGTLQLEAVQLATFGRKLEGRADTLAGYKLSMIKIEDPEVVATSGETHHPIIVRTDNPGDSITGTVFTITPDELKNADDYEVADYKRTGVVLKSGTKAWVYIKAVD